MSKFYSETGQGRACHEMWAKNSIEWIPRDSFGSFLLFKTSLYDIGNQADPIRHGNSFFTNLLKKY